MENIEIGTRYQNKKGIIGTVEEVRGVKRLMIRRNGRIVQSITLKDLDLKKFKRLDDE